MAVDKLSQGTAIVDSRGQPSKEFMIKWAQLANNLATIVPLSTAAQVSAVLDVISTAAGALLVRGSTVWSPLAIGAANTLLTSTGSAPAWQGLSATLDAVFGSTQGMLLYRAGGAWAALAPGAAGQALLTGGASANPSWGAGGASSLAGLSDVAISGPTNGQVLTYDSGSTKWKNAAGGGGGGGSGLYASLMSALPTQSGTGLSTWVNQRGSTVADTAAGVTMTAPSAGGANNSIFYRAAPAAPYTLTVLLAITRYATSYDGAGLCFYDGSAKFSTISLISGSGGVTYVDCGNWNNTASFAGANADTGLAGYSTPIWLQLKDDGTNVYFSFSYDGVNFFTHYSVAKASGFLGASGYSNIGLIINPQGSKQTIMSVLSWAIA